MFLAQSRSLPNQGPPPSNVASNLVTLIHKAAGVTFKGLATAQGMLILAQGPVEVGDVLIVSGSISRAPGGGSYIILSGDPGDRCTLVVIAG